MIWHLEEMPAKGKTGTSWVARGRMLWISQGVFFTFCSRQRRRSSVHFLKSVLKLSGRLAVSERGACLKCCYLTWQEQDCWQSPETTPCQWNTNRLWDGFTVWGTHHSCAHALWWPFLTVALTNKTETCEATWIIFRRSSCRPLNLQWII